MKPLRFHPEVDPEVDDAVRFYESRGAGLGHDLLTCMELVVREVQVAPSRCRYIKGNLRKRHLLKFPYSVVFENRDNEIFVITLMHDRRQPDYWQERLASEE